MEKETVCLSSLLPSTEDGAVPGNCTAVGRGKIDGEGQSALQGGGRTRSLRGAAGVEEAGGRLTATTKPAHGQPGLA